MSNALVVAISIFVLFGSWSLYLAFKLDKANTTINALRKELNGN